MVFNPRGLTLKDHPDHIFVCGHNKLEVASEYTYLGLKLKPSGVFTMATEELYKKASRAWFAISNIVYQHKKLPISRAFQIFESLVAPVALYGCELWTPYSLIYNTLPCADSLHHHLTHGAQGLKTLYGNYYRFGSSRGVTY